MNPFLGSIWAEEDRRGGSTGEQSFKRAPMVTGVGWGDSGRGEAGLGVGEVGGGAGEGARIRNRDMVAGGRRSKGGGDGGASGRAPPGSSRREIWWPEEGGDDSWSPQPGKISRCYRDPAYVRTACEGSLNRLGVDCIDLYYQHRINKRVPIEVTVS